MSTICSRKRRCTWRSREPIAFPGHLERLLLVDDAVDRMIAANETALRRMIASTAKLPLQSTGVPARQNRRLPLIEAALEPARSKFSASSYRQLTRALSLVIGTEAMLVLKDVLALDGAEAREVRRLAIASLLDSALRNEFDRAVMPA